MSLTLRQMQAFLAVAEQGSFTKAAERLRVAQPALSQLIRDLEQELGIRVFDRTTRRTELTEGGREFRGAAAKIVADIDVAIQNANGLAKRERGRVTIAAPPLLSSVLIPHALEELHQRYPGIQASLIDAPTNIIVEAVRLGQADCGVGTFLTVEDGIERLPLARDQLLLFCPNSHRLAEREFVSWADLAGEQLVTLTRASAIRLLVEVGFETNQIPLRPRYEVSQITTALALVEAGIGVAVLPTYARAAAHDRLTVLRLVDPAISRDIVMIRSNARTATPAVLGLETILRSVIRRLAPE